MVYVALKSLYQISSLNNDLTDIFNLLQSTLKGKVLSEDGLCFKSASTPGQFSESQFDRYLQFTVKYSVGRRPHRFFRAVFAKLNNRSTNNPFGRFHSEDGLCCTSASSLEPFIKS